MRNASLSAATGSFGSVTASGIISVSTSGAIVGGNFSSVSWPGSGGGFAVGYDSGVGTYRFRMGRYTGSAGQQYVEINADGSFYSPGLVISGGAATFSGVLSAVTGDFADLRVSGLIRNSTKTNWDSGSGVMLGSSGSDYYLSCMRDVSGVKTGFWMTTASGGQINMAGAVIVNSTINSATFDSFTCSIPGGNINTSTSNGGASYGSRSVTTSGGKPTLTYYWAVTSLSSDNTNYPFGCSIANETTSNPTFNGWATNNKIYVGISCTVTDANGRTATASMRIQATHGTPP